MDPRRWLEKTGQLLSRTNVQLTLVYALCFGILGAVLSGMGPSLPELGRRTQRTDEEMAWILGVRAFGYFVGSMGGPLYDRLPGNYVLIFALSICGVSCALVGFVRQFGLLFIVVPFQGICMGLLDTGGNVMTLWLHPKDPEPFMQSLHFAFAVGGLIAPLLIGQIAKHQNGSITISWLIIAALFVPAILLLLKYESPKEPPRPVTEDGQIVTYTGFTLVVLLATAAFLFFDIGAEASVATYIVTYIIRRGLHDETTATLINSLFWVFMVLGRLLAIPISTVVKSHHILVSMSILCTIATGMWLIFYKSFAVLAVSMVLYGLGMSVAFATAVLLAQYYIPISGRAGTVFVVGAACGEFIIPITLSQLFVTTNYMSLPIFMVAASIICLFLVGFIIWAGEHCPKTKAAPSPDNQSELDIMEANTTPNVSAASENTPTTQNKGTSSSIAGTNTIASSDAGLSTPDGDENMVRLEFDD